MLVTAARVLQSPDMAPALIRTLPATITVCESLARVQTTKTASSQLILGDLPVAIIAASGDSKRYSRTEWNTYMMWMHSVMNTTVYCDRPGLSLYDHYGRLAAINPAAIPAARADMLSGKLSEVMRDALREVVCMPTYRDPLHAREAVNSVFRSAARKIMLDVVRVDRLLAANDRVIDA